jgi:hypothetical protein
MRKAHRVSGETASKRIRRLEIRTIPSYGTVGRLPAGPEPGRLFGGIAGKPLSSGVGYLTYPPCDFAAALALSAQLRALWRAISRHSARSGRYMAPT